MIIHNPILTGSFTVNGTDVSSITSSAASLTSLNAYTASQNNRNGTYATTGSNTFAGIQTVNSNLVVTGSITAQTLVVQTVTSSVIYSSGSNVFGNNIANTQVFTGSMSLTGSLTVVTTGTEFQVNANGVKFGNVIGDAHNITGSVIISGSIGIGVTPSQKFQVRGTNENAIVRVETTGSGNPSISFTTLGQQDWGIGVDFTDSGKLKFDGATTVGAATRMTLTNAGNLGIGTTSPSFPLEVNTTATGLIARFTSNQNEAQIRLVNTSTGGRSYSLGSGGTSSGGARGFYIYDETGTATVFAISGSGNVGVGTSTPNGRLEVVPPNISGNEGIFINQLGSHQSTMRFKSAHDANSDYRIGASILVGSAFEIYSVAAAASRLVITSGGTVVIGSTLSAPTGGETGWWIRNGGRAYFSSAESPLTCNRYGSTGIILSFDYGGGSVGNISTNGSTVTFSGTAASDARLKNNIQPITNALDAINAVEFVTFKFKENNKDSAGVTAQNLQTIEKLSPFVIDGATEEDYKAVDYNAIIGYLGKAIQELKAEIDILKNN